MYLLQITLVGLTCCPVRNWANLRMSMRASANWWGSASGASLLCELGTLSLSVRIFLRLFLYLHVSTCTWQSNENYFKLHKSSSLIYGTYWWDSPGLWNEWKLTPCQFQPSISFLHFDLLRESVEWKLTVISIHSIIQNWNCETKSLMFDVKINWKSPISQQNPTAILNIYK